ncbi:MAG: glycyl-radical enzyme activating protein [Desulfosporosinus sp.]|nr:glycyl-radical enzyme activating protein [Desulfosporosinus sp.]
MSTKAIIKVIDEYAVHDGPGARALVFLKGCNLHCKWCQNPELIKFKPEIWFHKALCKGCGKCQDVCPVNAINLEEDIKRIDKEKCLGVDCSKCVEVCPSNALQVVGYEITAEELWRQLAKYKCFYQGSGGGITLSGGDPLHLPDFSAEVLGLCQKDNINTAIETSLYGSYKNLWKIAKYCDLILTDIKHMDSEKHKEGTGVSNELILENFKKLNKNFKGEIVVRVPLIPGYNDDEENIRKTAEFLAPLERIKGIDLLPFNVFPIAKFKALGIDWVYKGVQKQSDKHLSRLYEIVKSYKAHCTVGGMW